MDFVDDWPDDVDDNSDCDSECLTSTNVSSSSVGYSRLVRAQVSHTDSVYPRPEVKILNSGFNSYSVTSTGSLFNVNLLASGTGLNQRIGNQFTCKSVSWNIVPQLPPATAGLPTPSLLMILFWDTSPNLGTITPSSLLNLVQGAISPISHINDLQRQRIIVLKKWCFPNMNGTVNYETGKIPINKVSTTNSAGNIVSGALNFFLISNSTTAALNSFSFRLRYYDN